MKTRNDKIISAVLGSLALPVVMLCFVIILTFILSAVRVSTFNLTLFKDSEYFRLFLNIMKNTLLISVISLSVSSPIAYFAAFNLCFIQEGKTRTVLLSIIRILSSYPSVLIGFLVASLFVRNAGTGSFILYASLVLTMVILPFLCNNFCNDMLSVPDSLMLASDAMGMKLSHKLRYIIHPYTRRKTVSSVLLSLCRCIGEATALFIVCNAISLIGGSAQYTFASYILYSFAEGIPQQNTWQMVVLITLIFTIFYYLLFFLQQKIRGGDR